MFQVGPYGNLTLENLTVNNGTTTDTAGGGGILNQGFLSLENVTVTTSRAPQGGGIASTGPSLAIDHSFIKSNYASISGGGVFTSSPTATFTHDQFLYNAVTGADHSSDTSSANPSAGGLAEGGGLDISSGNVSISFTAINGNAVQAGAGGPGSAGTSYDFHQRPFQEHVQINGTAGGTGIAGGLGGQAQGGGIAVDGGSLSIANSTLSNNIALGSLGGTGGAGGTGQGALNGFDSDGVDPSSAGGTGGAGGQGGIGGAGGPGHGGGLFLAQTVSNLTMTDTTVADNQATGGQGGQSGAGGNGGDGGEGGAGSNSGFSSFGPGAGGVGGNGGNGGTTGAPGPADGAGIYFDPSYNARQIASSTIAFNNVARGADALPVTILLHSGSITLPASPGGTGGPGGYPGQPAPQVPASRGVDGVMNGVLGAPQAVLGGGLFEDGSVFGVSLFGLNLFNSIVAANTGYINSTSYVSDIYGTLATPSSSYANLIGTDGTGGLVNGQSENQVNVGWNQLGLLPLGNYGGETQTIALAANSPAVGAGDRTFNSVPNDQRGFSRLRGNTLDIGAFELQQFTLSPTLPNATEGEPYSQTVLATAGDVQGVATFVVSAGSLPSGMSLSSAGVLSGVPTTAGPFTFTVTGSDYLGSVSQPYGLTINPPPAPVVDTLADRPFDYDFSAGHLSLREALYLAQLPGVTTPVTFAPGLTGTITLTQGELQIANSMTIDGPGANLLSISGNNVNRVLEVDSGSVTISGLSIVNGYANAFSSSNPNGGSGGGILNLGNLTLNSVAVSNNTAQHSAGGIVNIFGQMAVVNSTITGNTANEQGGGIVNEGNGASTTGILTLDSVVISNNAAASGGGVFCNGGSFTVTASSISNNNALYGLGDGGGIYNSGFTISTVVVNSTISDNSALDNGGGIYNPFGAEIALINATIAANTAAYNTGLGGSGTADMTNSIIVEETNYLYSIHFHGVNLIAGSNIAGVISADPHLGPLQNNGGPTPTMALLPGSPAIDAGVNSYALDAQGNPLTTDQNGRPRIRGANVDLGAYEVQPASLGTAPGNGQEGTPYSQTLTAAQPGHQTSWGTLTFAVTAGTLPTGLSLSPAGVLSGTPIAAGTFTFTVTASDLAGFGSQQYSVTINPPPAPVVDTLADNFDYDYSPGHLSLREALYIAQLPGVNAPVTFVPGLQGNIVLTGGPLAITSGVTIEGGDDLITVDGGGQSSVFHIAGADPAHPITTNISDLTVADARNGPGIFNTNDTLTLDGVEVINNFADGIDNNRAALSVVNSTIGWNLGSGIADTDGAVTVVDSTVANNQGGDQNGNGGGISVIDSGQFESTLTAVNTTIADNVADLNGGGIYASGAVIGAFAARVDVTLTNVTVAGNSANDGAGIYNSVASRLTLYNTIIGANTGAPDLTNDETFIRTGGGAITVARGGNLVESVEKVVNGVSVPVGSEFDASPPVITANPMLGPLQHNGGFTTTMAIPAGSPAIDAGDSTIAGLPATDQRGYSRIFGRTADLGAYEYGAVNSTGNDLSVSATAPAAISAGGQITYQLTVTNSSPDYQRYVTLADALPANTTLVSWTAPAGGWFHSAPPVGSSSGTVTAHTVVLIAANSSANFTLVVQVNSGTPAGAVITNTASVGPTDGDPNPGNNSVTVNTNVIDSVAAVQVNDGSAQRSEVRSIKVTFSGPVTFAGGNAAAAFQLLHVQTGNNVALSATTATDSLGRTVVTLGFSGGETDPVSALNGGIASLADGRYQLTVLAGDVIASDGSALAGDGADTGSNYVSPADTYGGNGLHLYRLFGDVNGDGVVDATDVGQLKSTFNRNNTDPLYLWYLDADNSGAVDASDIGQFKSRFNVNVFG